MTISRGGRSVAGFALGSPGVVSDAANVGYFAVGLAVIGLAVYGGWVLWERR
jgi:hypothetical protein